MQPEVNISDELMKASETSDAAEVAAAPAKIARPRKNTK
jgi:hypothetical protein